MFQTFVSRTIQALTLLGLTAGIANAKDYRISPDTNVESLAKQVAAGDTLILQDGTWNDAQLKFELLQGSEESPVHIRAQTAGQVIFTGKTEFRLSGTHVIVSGLVFRDTQGASDVVQLRSHSQRHAHHCRVTDCVFEQTPDSEAGTESRWLSIYGTQNRVDHCYFGGKKNRGTTLVVWVGDEIEGHRIDHNHFGPRPELGRNGGETIRIGTSDVSEQDCRTIVEDNYFHSCDGEAEIISNKSCGNIYRHNAFDACSGTLTLRHGHRCVVDANVFLGHKKRGTGGVRVIGQNHAVTNNYFESLRGDAERAAICLMNGIPDGPLNGYAPVRDALIAHNTFVDCKVTIEIGVGAGKKQSAAPAACRVTHNAFLPGKWSLFRVHAEPMDFVWQSNKHQLGRAEEKQPAHFERIDLQFERASDGLIRPASSDAIRAGTASPLQGDLDGYLRGDDSLVGCDDPTTPLRPRPTALNTGPLWRESGRAGHESE
jgi:poly(beta-D-mannuronate) lyase